MCEKTISLAVIEAIRIFKVGFHMKKTVSKSQYVYNKTPVSPSCSSSLVDQKNIFLANQKQAIQTFLELAQ